MITWFYSKDAACDAASRMSASSDERHIVVERESLAGDEFDYGVWRWVPADQRSEPFPSRTYAHRVYDAGRCRGSARHVLGTDDLYEV